MIRSELTRGARPATSCGMQMMQYQRSRSGWRAARAAAMLMAGALTLSGCVSVKAPDKPIVIELNINIKQDVVYSLAADAANTIESKPEIF